MTDKVKDKLQARAKRYIMSGLSYDNPRFNIVSADEKARAREAKFGTASNNIGQSDPTKSSDRSKRYVSTLSAVIPVGSDH